MKKRTKREWITLTMGFWVIAGISFAALTFAYKVYEIVNTVPNGEMAGFAVMQVLTYLIVAVGFFSLFIWSFLKGDFAQWEDCKYRVLEMEEKMRRIEERRQ